MRAPKDFDLKKMPAPSEVVKLMKKVCERPNTRLADLSVNGIFDCFDRGTAVWLTGSSVWLPASFGEMPERECDLDLVFEDPITLQVWANALLQTLNCRMMGVTSMKEFPKGVAGFTVIENKLGGARILHPDGKGVIDMWHLAENQSIAELVSDYPGETYIRCAWHLSRSPSVGSLLRLAKEDVDLRSKRRLFDDEIHPASGYPGRGKTVPMRPGLLNAIIAPDPPQKQPDRLPDLSRLLRR